jgi:hypothetical protein
MQHAAILFSFLNGGINIAFHHFQNGGIEFPAYSIL